MKLFTAVLLLILSIGAFASRDVQVFSYDGSQEGATLGLRAEKTHIEYRYEQRREICYRREVYYQTVCHQTPQGRICNTYPHYRDIPYSCIRTVQVPYEVHDYFTEANVNISVVNKSGVAASAEQIVATLDGDRLTLSAKGSKKFIIVQKSQALSSQMSGGVKYIDANYEVELVEALPVVRALKVTDIRLLNSTLKVKTGPASSPLVGFSLTVKKAPVVGSDTVLFDRELASAEVSTSNEANSAQRSIDLGVLGVELKGGRHTLTAKTFFKAAGPVLNREQFSEVENFEASRTLIYKAR